MPGARFSRWLRVVKDLVGDRPGNGAAAQLLKVTPMPKKPHPADVRDAEIVANAVKFEVSVFLGTGKFDVVSAKTLDEAKAKAAALEAHHKGRKAMIYGVDAQDRRAMYVDAAGKNGIPDFLDRKINGITPAQGPAKKPATIIKESTTMKTENTESTTLKAAGKKIAKEAAALKAAKPAKAEAAKLKALNQPEMAREIEKAAAKSIAKTAKAKATRAAKPAKAKSTKPAVNGKELLMGSKSLGKRAQVIADAQAGKLPSPPDFSADTHTRFRPKLAEVVEMVKARDLKALKAWKFEGFMSTSPKAIQRYRDLAIVALQAKAAK